MLTELNDIKLTDADEKIVKEVIGNLKFPTSVIPHKLYTYHLCSDLVTVVETTYKSICTSKDAGKKSYLFPVIINQFDDFTFMKEQSPLLLYREYNERKGQNEQIKCFPSYYIDHFEEDNETPLLFRSLDNYNIESFLFCSTTRLDLAEAEKHLRLALLYNM